MPNLIDVLTKPLQIGARVAFGAIHAVQGLIGGRHHEEPQPEPAPEEQAPKPAPRRRNTKPKRLDDATITAKVETELFRDDAVDKGKIDVNTAGAVVWLRGEAKTPEQIKGLEAQALAIPEVKRVENLLHLPKTPAPTRADTPPAQQKTRRSKATAAKRKATPAPVTAERKTPSTPAAEPTPKELAEAGQGRKPAPLGSSDNGSGS